MGKRSRLKFRVQETDGEEFPESQDEVMSQGWRPQAKCEDQSLLLADKNPFTKAVDVVEGAIKHDGNENGYLPPPCPNYAGQENPP